VGHGQKVKFLLDTHAVDWAQTGEHRLSAKALAIVRDARPGDLAVSDVTLSELARHLASGKISTQLTPEEWIRAATAGIEVLPVTGEIAIRAAFLDWTVAGRPHRDPCDRHIVATAVEHQLPLLTIDEKMHALTGVRGLRVIW
jgi:PIN domain nuclease of toxin-antitoxin system